MQAAQHFEFARLVGEFSAWRAVPEDERAPAAAWWWSTALSLRDEQEALPNASCEALQMPVGSRYADAAAMLMTAIAEQDEWSRPDEWPRKPKTGMAEDEAEQPKLAAE